MKISYNNIAEFAKNKKIIVYSEIHLLSFMLNFLNGKKVSYVCNDDMAVNGEFFRGLEIKPPMALLEEDVNNIFVIVSDENAEEKIKQLNILGIESYVTNKTLVSNLNQEKDLVVGEEFLIDENDTETMEKIKKLLTMVEDNESRRHIEHVVNLRMNNCLVSWSNKYRKERSNTLPYFSTMLYKDKIEEEIIIDGGALNINFFCTFYKYLGPSLKKFYAFEPDQEAAQKILEDCKNEKIIDFRTNSNKIISKISNVVVMPYALSNVSDIGGRQLTLGEVVEDESEEPDFITKTIDDVIDINEKITLIKLDVEGHEMKALEGAVNTITKHKPRLVICIYHWPGDLWEIPFYIKEKYPDYKLYVRPHDGLKAHLELHAVL